MPLIYFCANTPIKISEQNKCTEYTQITLYTINSQTSILQTEYHIEIPYGRYQNCCVFNKFGKILATAGVGGSVYLWTENSVSGGWECAAELANITMTTVTSISWDPSSQYICTGQYF